MSKTSTAKTPRKKAAFSPLPDIDEALRGLAVGQTRAILSLVLRLFAVAFLLALLTVQISALRRGIVFANAVGIALIVWPFFTSLGRLYAWRIALGRRCAEAGRWEDAARVLAPLTRPAPARLFDAAGEGRYHLTLAWDHLGRGDDARRLRSELATLHANTEWGRRAQQDETGTTPPAAA